VKIAGANFDSSKDETTERWEEQRHPAPLPACDSRAKTTKTGSEVGGRAISSADVRVGAASAGRAAASANQDAAPHVTSASSEISSSESTDDDNEEAASHVMFASSVSSCSESDDDEKDFLDLLVDTLDGDFDPDLFI
jgi:hypothetical protein